MMQFSLKSAKNWYPTGQKPCQAVQMSKILSKTLDSKKSTKIPIWRTRPISLPPKNKLSYCKFCMFLHDKNHVFSHFSRTIFAISHFFSHFMGYSDVIKLIVGTSESFMLQKLLFWHIFHRKVLQYPKNIFTTSGNLSFWDSKH